MNTLPPELHSHIFDFACADDGTTAKSLSLVSQYIHIVSKPFLYQSISISGSDKLLTLQEKLTKTPLHLLKRVKHLFLSDWTAADINPTSKTRLSSDDDSLAQYDLEMGVLIHTLSLVSTSLESLTTIFSNPFISTQIIGHLFSLPFPNLQTLNIHGFYPFPPHSSNSMPRLKILHLSGNRNPHGLFQTGGLALTCPNLEELKISGLVSANSFIEELDETILVDTSNPPPSSGADFLFPISIPPTLRHISITPGPSPPEGRRYQTASMSHEKMKERLSQLEVLTNPCGDEPTGNFPVRLTRVQEGKAEKDDLYTRMKDEWLKSIG